MASATLSNIRTKVRRLTRSPSASLLSNTEIDFYVNTFIAWDFPEHLRLKGLRTTLTWYTKANVDTYTTTTTVATDPLYNFKNKYITIHEPIYIAGYRSFYTQSREQLFNIYPLATYIKQVGLGDGLESTFTGTLNNKPFLANNVLFNSIDTNGVTMSYKDVPIDSSYGALVNTTTEALAGTVYYLTGVFTITFINPPAASAKVNAQTVPYQPARPVAVCFYHDTFTLRPVPDQAYAVNMEAYVQPTELMDSTDTPDYGEFWQYIAIGAAKKIFEDRSDMESVQKIMPIFKEQEELINRRTIVQQSNERSATIYTGQDSIGSGWPGWWVNG